MPDAQHYLALWALLACLTVLSIFAPGHPTAIHAPRLSVAVGSIAAVVGLGLLQLGWLRFRAFHRAIDLHTGLAFGVLAAGNVFSAWAGFEAGGVDTRLEQAAYFTLLLRAAAVALFLTGLATAQRHEVGSSWRWSGWVGLACASVLAILSVSALAGMSDQLPQLLDRAAQELLATGTSIDTVLPGQEPVLVLANVALATAFLISAIGYTREARRLRDPQVAALAAALIFFFFGQLITVFFPALPTDYVSAADGFTLVADVLLLSNMMWRTGHDFTATATHDERLRLSRELHDGLAQQLAMLRLRLGRVAELTMASDERAHDLDVAQRVLDTASMEARRAISALRNESMPWDDFIEALRAFCAEFSLTHDVDARICVGNPGVRIDGQLAADAVRIIQETFSNAVRHGQARRVVAVVGIEREALRMEVQDDGRGFVRASTARTGLGLRSISERAGRHAGSVVFESRPGGGTRVQLSLPLRRRDRS